MASMLQGSIRNRFQILSRKLQFGGVQSVQPITWSIFQTLLGKDRAGILEHGNLLPIRRSAGSHLDIKKHHKRRATQIAKYTHLPVIHINATFNNTIITVSDKDGKMLGWVSAGSEGFQNARRGSSTAGRQAGIAAAQKAISNGVERARIKVRGIGTGRQGAVNGIESAGVQVVSVTDVTPVPHNGCKPRKTRRL
ncbi:uncharacterized protein LOC110063330 [Orbicella faveolata]|uniref:uncharacterized protein LOC110063330 n=1 Tax=Orbicella faveolata TaxID=48498 RepID=UPI0009E40589|nr:uncharacterized protein LOC110063330 [Orbicella faveolata]